jgi:hypothetical protein
MSEDKKLLDSISALLLDPSHSSPFAKINPSITDERRRELTRHAFRSFAAEVHVTRSLPNNNSEIHKVYIWSNHSDFILNIPVAVHRYATDP